MKNVNFFILLLLGCSLLAKGQNNYVVNTPNSTTPGTNNVLIGAGAGNSTLTGERNTFIGLQAGQKTTSGGFNVFLGNAAGGNNTTGGSNLFMGSFAGYGNTTGSLNLFIGNSSGQQTISGDGNTFIGDGSGYGNTGGSRNTYIGQYAGFTGNGNGTNNTFIGYSAGVSSNTAVVNNAMAIGSNALVSQSNSVVLGGTGVNSVSVGIGTSTPGNKLEITAGATNKSGLRFTNLTSSAQGLIDLTITLANPVVKVLTVDENGDVVLRGLGVNLGVLGGRVAAGADASTGVLSWSLNGSTIQSISDNPVSIGGNINRLPTGYKLYVADGILTEKVKVAVKNTDEWSDKVFDSKYRLKSLTEVDRYIKSNKHLPGIPSAKEMVEQGNDLHKTDAKLLEKIEELTLYMIELKKSNQSLKQSVNALQRQNQLIKHKLFTLAHAK